MSAQDYGKKIKKIGYPNPELEGRSDKALNTAPNNLRTTAPVITGEGSAKTIVRPQPNHTQPSNMFQQGISKNDLFFWPHPVTGGSLGPVVEFKTKGGNTRLGVQGSCWINYFVGFDYRVRYIGNEKLHYTGI